MASIPSGSLLVLGRSPSHALSVRRALMSALGIYTCCAEPLRCLVLHVGMPVLALSGFVSVICHGSLASTVGARASLVGSFLRPRGQRALALVGRELCRCGCVLVVLAAPFRGPKSRCANSSAKSCRVVVLSMFVLALPLAPLMRDGRGLNLLTALFFASPGSGTRRSIRLELS